MLRHLINLTALGLCTTAFANNQSLSQASGYLKQATITISNTTSHSIALVSHLANNRNSNGQPYAIRCLKPILPQQFSWIPIRIDDHTTVLAQGITLNTQQHAKLQFDIDNPACQDRNSVADSLASYSSNPAQREITVDDDLNFQYYDAYEHAISFYADEFVNPSNISIDTQHSVITITPS